MDQKGTAFEMEGNQFQMKWKVDGIPKYSRSQFLAIQWTKFINATVLSIV